jgi:NRDE-2, necessary for RNA interference
LSPASHKDKVAELEDFWESEVPRFAEANATGWTSWTVNRTGSKQSPQSSEKGDPVADNDPYTGWMGEESLRETPGHFSTRSWNESEEDPYSTVIFLDLQDYLTEVITDRGKELLRLAFLAFLGVPIPGIDNHLCPSLSSTPYRSPSELVVDPELWGLSTDASWPSNPLSLFPSPDVSRTTTWESIAGITVGTEHRVASGFGPVHHWGYGTRGWLEGVGKTCEQRMWEGCSYGPAVEAIRRTFEQLRATMADEATRVEWDSMGIAWEASISTKKYVFLIIFFYVPRALTLPECTQTL